MAPNQITQPGQYLYHDAIGNDPVPVVLLDVGECGLGVFFEGREDYDLVDEVSGRFEPVGDRLTPAELEALRRDDAAARLVIRDMLRRDAGQ